MKRPNKNDYLTTNQFEYSEKLNRYHEQLEKYIDYVEQQLILNSVVFSERICENCKYNNPKKAHMKCQSCDDDYSNFKRVEVCETKTTFKSQCYCTVTTQCGMCKSK